MKIIRFIEAWLKIFYYIAKLFIIPVEVLMKIAMVLIAIIHKTTIMSHKTYKNPVNLNKEKLFAHKTEILEPAEVFEDKLLQKEIEIIESVSRVNNLFHYIREEFKQFSLDTCKKTDEFKKKSPTNPLYPRKPSLKNEKYKTHYQFCDYFSPQKIKRKKEQQFTLFKNDLHHWELLCNKITQNHIMAVTEWEKEKEAFYTSKRQYNDRIEETKQLYQQKNPRGLLYLGEFALNSIRLPGKFENKFKVGFDKTLAIYIIDFLLPGMEIIPKVKDIFLDERNKEIKEEKYSWDELSFMYENMVFHIIIGCLYVLHRIDTQKMIKRFIYNGYVRQYVNEESNYLKCIISAQVPRKNMNNATRYTTPEIFMNDFECRLVRPLSYYNTVRPFFTLTKKVK